MHTYSVNSLTTPVSVHATVVLHFALYARLSKYVESIDGDNQVETRQSCKTSNRTSDAGSGLKLNRLSQPSVASMLRHLHVLTSINIWSNSCVSLANRLNFFFKDIIFYVLLIIIYFIYSLTEYESARVIIPS